jgi:hypothetical protein
MRFTSLEYFGLSAWRLACVGVALSSGAWVGAEIALGGVLGESEPAVLLVVSVLVFYLVVSVPRRVLDGQRAAEARESVLLSASAKACLNVTGSRARTLMMLRPREAATSRSVAVAARLVLLGTKVEDALEEASVGLVSYSAGAALRGLASLLPEGFEGGDEETRGLAAYKEMSRETKIPMFMTVCFFSPIMIILYAVFSHSYGAYGVTELAVLEFVVVDLAYYLSSADRGER